MSEAKIRRRYTDDSKKMQKVNRTLSDVAFQAFVAMDETAQRAFAERLNAFHRTLGHSNSLRWQLTPGGPAPETQKQSGIVSICPLCDIAGCKHLRATPAPSSQIRQGLQTGDAKPDNASETAGGPAPETNSLTARATPGGER